MASTRTSADQGGRAETPRDGGPAAAESSAIAGLDSLELGQVTAASGVGRLARRAVSATWPKLLAIAIVLGAWELFYLSNFHGDSTNGLVKGPGAGLANLGGQ